MSCRVYLILAVCYMGNKVTNTRIVGAGVLLISKYNDEPCIVIYQMARRHPVAIIMCDTLGGHIDNDERPHEAAVREAYEESAATIKISPTTLLDMDISRKFVDVPNYNERGCYFRAYVVSVKNVHEDAYCRNVRYFLRNGPKHYAETDELVRCYMSDVYRFIKNNNTSIILDVTGRERRLTKRTVSILRAFHAARML